MHTEFFNELRVRRWAFYVPERIYRAHRDGLLRGWGMEVGRMMRLLPLLREQGADLKIPFWKSPDLSWKENWFWENWILKKFSDLVVPYEEVSNCPPFPEPVITSDSFWDAFRKRFGLTGYSVINKVLAADGWAHQVSFFALWVSIEVGKDISVEVEKDKRPQYNLPFHERRDVNRRATLIILQKAYPPEQVRHVRRKLEEMLRKDPAEAIRYGLERRLLK